MFRVILRLYSLGTQYKKDHTVEMSYLPVLQSNAIAFFVSKCPFILADYYLNNGFERTFIFSARIWHFFLIVYYEI